MEILLGLISGLLWPTLIIVGIVWVIKKVSGPTTTNPTRSEYQVSIGQPNEKEIRAKIAEELRAQSGQYKLATQKKVVEDMAQTVEYFGLHGYQEQVSVEEDPAEMPAYEYTPQTLSAPKASEVVYENEVYETPWKKLQVLDGATILLYLGAFFLLASIGLYVGLGAGTTLKAILVSLLVFGFYGGGLYLYQFTSRLKPVGTTFAAIGMATLPMAGAAIYYFALDKQNGPAVWLATSVLAIALYAHALYVFRNTLVSYMIVFSTLSVVLASISVLGLVPFYYIQGIGFAGLLFAAVAKLFGKQSVYISEAYERSASFMVPFSIALSVLFVLQVGWMQLALSLLMGAAYYAYLALYSTQYRSVYVVVAQLLAIKSVLSASYGVTGSGLYVGAVSVILAVTYMMLWHLVFAKKPTDNHYRTQIKYISLSLPLVSMIAFIGTANNLWIGLVALAVVAVSVYMYDRDVLSGLLWSSAILAIPFSVSYLTLEDPLAETTMSLLLGGLALLSISVRLLLQKSLGEIDSLIQQYISFTGVVAISIYLFGQIDRTQFVGALAVLVIFTLQAIAERSRQWLSLLAGIHLFYAFYFVLGGQYLFWFALVTFVYNLLLALIRKGNLTHDWIAMVVINTLPVLYSTQIAVTDWSERGFVFAYVSLFVGLIGFRLLRSSVSKGSINFAYITALSIYVLSSLLDTSLSGLIAVVGACALFYLFEKMESSRAYAYISPFLPILYLFSEYETRAHLAILLVTMTVLLSVMYGMRKRLYEGYSGVVYAVLSLWYFLEVITTLDTSKMTYIFFSISAVALLARMISLARKYVFADPVLLAYGLLLGLGVVYMLASGWLVVAIGLFLCGLLVTGTSYIERQPVLITPALLLGFASVLRFAVGYELGLNLTVSLLLILAHGSYWLLVISKLATVRAGYARLTLISVAGFIPVVGLAYFDRTIFPLALALFGVMLLRELWQKGQGAREVSILLIHGALLWWLYGMGIRELQVYSQSTAIVLACFAYMRRSQKDNPTTINSYLWSSVLVFTLPMVVQALSSDNPVYSYLLLFEHILLITISILFKRSTFAWWGIIVVVASVLYQLRKLRYAALAFLGVFIISLAVYFLLRYNRPEQDTKK